MYKHLWASPISGSEVPSWGDKFSKRIVLLLANIWSCVPVSLPSICLLIVISRNVSHFEKDVYKQWLTNDIVMVIISKWYLQEKRLSVYLRLPAKQKVLPFPIYCQSKQVFGDSIALLSFAGTINALLFFRQKVGTRVMTRLCGRWLNTRRANIHQLLLSIIVVMEKKVFVSLFLSCLYLCILVYGTQDLISDCLVIQVTQEIFLWPQHTHLPLRRHSDLTWKLCLQISRLPLV